MAQAEINTYEIAMIILDDLELDQIPVSDTGIKAWVATSEQTEDITTKELSALQAMFNNRLSIVRTKCGAIAITPDDSGYRNAFDDFMRANGAFTERPIDIQHI